MNKEYKKGEILFLTKDACEFLESLNLTYNEMVKYLAIKLSPVTIRKMFSKYGIAHKSKKILVKKYMLDNPDKSLNFVAVKFQCTRRWIAKIRKEIKNEKRSNI